MRQTCNFVVVLGCSLLFGAQAMAEPEIADAKLRQRMDELAASTMVAGAGWQAYEKLLHPAYSRWAMGEVYEGREKFVRSLEEWWDYGMRVSTRDVELIGVDLAGDVAIIRLLTNETFVGPDGESGGFSGHVTNIWLRDDDDWKLLAAEISPTARTD